MNEEFKRQLHAAADRLVFAADLYAAIRLSKGDVDGELSKATLEARESIIWLRRMTLTPRERAIHDAIRARPSGATP